MTGRHYPVYRSAPRRTVLGGASRPNNPNPLGKRLPLVATCLVALGSFIDGDNSITRIVDSRMRHQNVDASFHSLFPTVFTYGLNTNKRPEMLQDKTFGQRWEDCQGRWDRYKPSKALWLASCVGCAFLPAFVGYISNGWMSRRSANEIAMHAAVSARAELLAEMCGEHFVKSEVGQARIAVFAKADKLERSTMPQNGASAKLTGKGSPLEFEGRLCAERLVDEI